MPDTEILPPGGYWSGIIPKHHRLKIVDIEGGQGVDFLCYNEHESSDRYNAANTIKLNGNIYILWADNLIYYTIIYYNIISQWKWIFSLNMIKRENTTFDDYNISPKRRQVLQHWGYQLTEKDFYS